MLDKIDQIKKQFDADCQSIKNLESLENLRIKYLGRKGLVSEAFSLLSQVSKDEKPKFGQGSIRRARCAARTRRRRPP